jgi:hypothetical protein
VPGIPSELFGVKAEITFRDLSKEKANFSQQLLHISELSNTNGTNKFLSFHIQPDNVSKLSSKVEENIVGPHDQHLYFALPNRKEINSNYYTKEEGKNIPVKIAEIKYSSKETQRLLISIEVANRFINAARVTSDECGPTLIGVLVQNKNGPSEAKAIISRIDLQKAK